MLGSVYFTESSGYRSLKNRSCVTVLSSCSATLTVGEPLGDVYGSANHDFRTSVTGISGEIDASKTKTIITGTILHKFMTKYDEKNKYIVLNPFNLQKF